MFRLTDNMRDYFLTTGKGILCGGLGYINGTALAGHPIPPVMGFAWIPSFGGWIDVFGFIAAFGGAIVVPLTLFSLVLKVKRQWKERNKERVEDYDSVID